MAKQETVLVDGATGYVGTHLTNRLLKDGHDVTCLVHPGASRADVELLRKMGAEIAVGTLDTSDYASPVLAKAFAGANVIVHLIGSIAPKKGESFAKLHSGQTECLVHHARQSGAKVLMVTALGADDNAPSEYHKSKFAAEEVIRESGLPFAVFRPSLIVGRLVGRRNSKLVMRFLEFIASRPVVPVIGGGHNKLQPVFVADLVEAITQSASSRLNSLILGKVHEIGGPDVVELQQLVRMLMQVVKVYKPIVAVPASMMRVAAMFCEMTQDVPVVSKDQVTLSLRDNICSENRLASILGKEPTPLAEALQTYADKRDPVSTGAMS